MSKILVIRLSAIGDVAMTIPVIYSVAAAYPQDSFTILTQTFLLPVFVNHPSNVTLLGINTKGTEKTFGGLVRFASTLVRDDFDKVIDLHRIIRPRIIDFFFRLKGTPVYAIHRDRKVRKKLVSKENKVLKPLQPVVEIYAEVFRQAGFEWTETFTSLFDGQPVEAKAIESFTGKKEGKWIGIAPFARHQGKIYPLEQMEKVVEALSRQKGVTLFLFGGRGKEEEALSQWVAQYPHVHSVAGRYALNQELMLISQLDLLLSMDSANMHFASLVGTRVLSVWGATHPYAGFYGFHQRPEDAIQQDLPCRPCSVYGNKHCFRGDWACMTQLKPAVIINKIITILEE